mmetsp:Transcript_8574/g.25633  ORF Transcript_8574/g.25633 Transcript_8574/m.25633 type:complete len:209 (-) Transcript_8574:3341-3967(-)
MARSSCVATPRLLSGVLPLKNLPRQRQRRPPSAMNLIPSLACNVLSRDPIQTTDIQALTTSGGRVSPFSKSSHWTSGKTCIITSFLQPAPHPSYFSCSAFLSAPSSSSTLSLRLSLSSMICKRKSKEATTAQSKCLHGGPRRPKNQGTTQTRSNDWSSRMSSTPLSCSSLSPTQSPCAVTMRRCRSLWKTIFLLLTSFLLEFSSSKSF